MHIQTKERRCGNFNRRLSFDSERKRLYEMSELKRPDGKDGVSGKKSVMISLFVES